MSEPVSLALWVLVAVAVTAAVVWATITAQRLDRLHIRVDRSRDALQAALDRRLAVVVAHDPQLAHEARRVEAIPLRPRDFSARIDAEERFRARVDATAGGYPRDDSDANTRVLLAVRFYNDAVADTRALRLRPLVRVLRLGGTAPLPVYCDLREISA
ncbi:hypothetical protein [Corynebacterium timonense]|uniref:LemA protein n=1 Tax=Corynebacterium timonense TaxID=441500 RepID=A0A1H1NJV9_9CORY|nr:hypothetical protein [Corynebacterium timonense]SDR99207.1 hypothetical protein SAMN04488539_0795 [Corynebacterium timonense]